MRRLLIAASLLLTVTFSYSQEDPFGIEARVENTSLLISDLPPGSFSTMTVVEAFPQLSFVRPVLLVEAPDDSGRLFVVEQRGTIKVFDKSDPTSTQTFLDIQSDVLNDGEQGLLGLAFDPDYATGGEFYVYYSWDNTNPSTSVVARFTNADPSGNTVSNATEERLLTLRQPYSNHNGGMIAFGPDGMLYVSLGDGGSGGDPLDNGQDTTTLFGAILRLDVRSEPDPGLDYAIPPDNPFVGGGPDGTGTREEIYAYGLRNTWRFSFDRLTGDLWAGDVGQGAREEIDLITAGGNYGWNIMEGTICYPPTVTDCDQTGLILPIVDYPRSQGRSVSGGYVYYGSRLPELYGAYIYGDFATGRIWGLRYDGEALLDNSVLVSNSGLGISGFGQDSDGEVYIMDYYGGGIYQLDRSGDPPTGSDFPTKLSDIPALLAAGSGQDQTTLGIIPYEPSSKLWSDGAHKERFMAIPHLDQVGYQEFTGWDFPEETILIKNFLLPLDERDPLNTLKRIETRMLYRKDGQWHGFSYEWDEAETDAQLLSSSKTRDFTIITGDGSEIDYSWLYPSRNQCNQCHTTAANGVLGLNTAQMNFDFLFPESGVIDNQLRTYDHISLFTEPPPGAPETLPRMPDYSDESEGLEPRARAYLASNCAMCHQPDGPAPSDLDLRWQTGTYDMLAVGFPPLQGDLGIAGAQIIKPQVPEESIVPLRMRTLNPVNRMPPLASTRVDEEGVALIEEWIGSLPPTAGLEGWVNY